MVLWHIAYVRINKALHMWAPLGSDSGNVIKIILEQNFLSGNIEYNLLIQHLLD